MKQLLVSVLLAGSAPAANLQKQLDKMAAHFHGKVGLYAINVQTGDTVAIDPDQPVQTASVIKLPIMVETFAEVAAGKRSLQDKLVLTKENQVPGSGILTQLQPGLELTLYDAVVLMMDLSDNTATNMVIDYIGIPEVNRRAKAMGLKDTYLYKKVFKPAEGPMPPEQAKFGLGKATAVRSLEVVWPGSRVRQTIRGVPIDRTIEITEGRCRASCAAVEMAFRNPASVLGAK